MLCQFYRVNSNNIQFEDRHLIKSLEMSSYTVAQHVANRLSYTLFSS